MKKGFTLIELLIVVAIIAILAAIAVPNFLEAQTRAKVSRAKNDQRSLATGLEAYYVDNNTYPCAARDGSGNLTTRGSRYINLNPAGAGNVNKYLSNAMADTTNKLKEIYSFAARGTTEVYLITTPIGYVSSTFVDPFMDTKGATFCYFADTNGWILWSPGPDTDEASYTDMVGTVAKYLVETVYDSGFSQPSTYLTTGPWDTTVESFSYDPTNGTVSPGDIYKTKQ